MERIIQGESVEDCMRSTTGRTASAADDSGQPLPNYEESDHDKPSEADVDFMREQAGQDF